MSAGFESDGTLTAVDPRTPVDYLEPEESPREGTAAAVTVVERIAATFTSGDSRITLLAWRHLLGASDGSLRRCAARAGVSFAAISRRARIISEEFGLRRRDPHLIEMRRQIASESWRKRKRRAGKTDPPPVMNPLKNETPRPKEGLNE